MSVTKPGPNATAPYAALPAADDGRIVIVYVPHGTHRATTYDPTFAALAVRACNAHDALVAALERALLELSAIEHGLLGPEHAVRRNGCAAAALECRAALREVQP